MRVKDAPRGAFPFQWSGGPDAYGEGDNRFTGRIHKVVIDLK
jgi:hypothetical protein